MVAEAEAAEAEEVQEEEEEAEAEEQEVTVEEAEVAEVQEAEAEVEKTEKEKAEKSTGQRDECRVWSEGGRRAGTRRCGQSSGCTKMKRRRGYRAFSVAVWRGSSLIALLCPPDLRNPAIGCLSRDVATKMTGLRS